MYQKIIEYHDNKFHNFFGYYDRPQSIDGENFLFCRCVDQFESGSVHLYNKVSNTSIMLLPTSAISFQFGNLNSWVDDENIILHLRDDNRIYAANYSLTQKRITIKYPSACYTVNNKNEGVFWNIENSGLDRLAYGLGVGERLNTDVFVKNIMSQKMIGHLPGEHVKELLKSNHHWYMEHCVFISDKMLLLLYRTSKNVDGFKKESLILWDLQDNIVTPLQGYSKTSHFNGIGGAFIVFASRKKYVKNERLKSIVKKIPFLNKIRTNKKFRVHAVSERYWYEFNGERLSVNFSHDGHPTPVPGGYIFDTYEDEQNFRYLYHLNIFSRKITKISCVKSCSKTDSTSVRCDLHPRSVKEKDAFTYDFIRSGKRGFAYMVRDIDN